MHRYRFVVLALVCGLAFMGNFMQYQVSALALPVMAAMEIDTVGFSMLFLVPMLAAVFFGIPFGSLGDRFGPKKVIAACFCVSAIGGALRIAEQDNFPFQLFAMFLIGVGMASLSANVAKVISFWFGETTDKGLGAYYAVSCLGIVVAQVTGSLYPSVSQAYVVAEAVLLACIVLWIALGRDDPQGAICSAQGVTALSSFKAVSQVRAAWLLALAVGLSLAATTAYAGFLPQALAVGKGIEEASAGGMAAFVTVASIFGCLAGPVLSGKLGSLKGYLVVVNLCAAAAMFYTWYAAEGAVLWVVLFFNGFLTSMAGPVLQSIPVRLEGVGPRLAGSAGGIIGAVSLLMSFVLPTAISAVAGSDYTLNMGMESLCFCLSIVPILLLPKIESSS